MRIALFALSAAAGLGLSAAHANTFVLSPKEKDADDLFDLDHEKAYTWGINWSLPEGEQITSATFTIYDIWDWKKETDDLWIHLLDEAHYKATLNKKKKTWTYDDVHIIADDNEKGGDYFDNVYKGREEFLTHWSDPAGGKSTGFNLVYQFASDDIAALTEFAKNGLFGIGFDADCHYYNEGVELVINTAAIPVPEGGASALILGSAAVGVFALRRRFRQRPEAGENRE